MVHIALRVFEVDGRQHSVSYMFAFRVIEHFDVVEDVLSGLFAGLVGAAANAFTFEQVEEAFCNSVLRFQMIPGSSDPLRRPSLNS